MSGTDNLVIVDGYANFYRSFYAIRHLTNARGEAVNALYGSVRFALQIDQKLAHDYAVVVMDKGRPQRRLDILPGYKATRAMMPEDLRAQIPLIREWFEALGWAIVEEEGKEADDLIAGIVRRRAGRRTYVISHDKDLAQLVDDDVLMVAMGGKNSWELIGPAEVRQKFGISPGQVQDYLILLGDASDNVGGVPGIGAKTAAALLIQFGSLNGILENCSKITKPATREAIEANREIILRNRQLIALDEDLPPDWDGLEQLRRRSPNWDRLLTMARDQGFKSIVATLEKARDEHLNPMLF